MPPKVLCVDDESSIRESLSAILRIHGFDPLCAGTVPEALTAITSQQFDVLISDLNIGTPGDGFGVVSAMRCTQPGCVTFILTGFPAVETALQAIQQQVDEYLIKPIDVPRLISSMREKLSQRSARPQRASKRVSSILRENVDEIARRYLESVKHHGELGVLPLSDLERLDDLPAALAAIADQLDSEANKDACGKCLRSAAREGAMRYAQHLPLVLMVESQRLLERAIHEVIHENVLTIDLSHLLLDLNRLGDYLLAHLGESLRAYVEQQERDRQVA